MHKSYTLLKVLLEYAPNRFAQNIAVRNYHQMIADKLTQHDMEKELAGTILTGLAFGNWPWTPHTTEKADDAKV
jgi:hypothetical protein